jgi:hypothetical protein
VRFCDRVLAPLRFDGSGKLEQILNQLLGDISVVMTPLGERSLNQDSVAFCGGSIFHCHLF